MYDNNLIKCLVTQDWPTVGDIIYYIKKISHSFAKLKENLFAAIKDQ